MILEKQPHYMHGSINFINKNIYNYIQVIKIISLFQEQCTEEKVNHSFKEWKPTSLKGF